MDNEKLGRGIKDLLLENAIDISENEEIIEIEIDRIKSNPNQPRLFFDEEALNDLSKSIEEHGILQPVIVKPINNGYILVAGERRCKAAKLAGLTKVPAIIRDYNNVLLSELAILENLQREDLTPVEEAIAYKNAIKGLNITHSELGKKIGKSRSYISNMLGILTLPEEVIEYINKGNISMGHARALSKLKSKNRIIEIAKKIVEEKINVRDIEQITKTEKKKHRFTRKNISKKSFLTDKDIKSGYDIINKNIPQGGEVTIKDNEIIISFSSKDDYKSIIKKFDK